MDCEGCFLSLKVVNLTSALAHYLYVSMLLSFNVFHATGSMILLNKAPPASALDLKENLEMCRLVDVWWQTDKSHIRGPKVGLYVYIYIYTAAVNVTSMPIQLE